VVDLVSVAEYVALFDAYPYRADESWTAFLAGAHDAGHGSYNDSAGVVTRVAAVDYSLGWQTRGTVS
jgi:hypothetical protein